MRRGRRVFQAKQFDGLLELFAEDGVIISDDILGGFIESKGLSKLLDGPLRVRPGLPQIFENSVVANGKPEFGQFTLDSLMRPDWIFLLELSNELNQWPVNGRSAGLSAFPTPIVLKSLAMPADDGFRFDDDQRFLPFSEDLGQPDQKKTILRLEFGPFDRLLTDNQLLPQQGVFEIGIHSKKFSQGKSA